MGVGALAAGEGPAVSGPLAAALAIVLALITAGSGIIVARISKGKPDKGVTGNITVSSDYIQQLRDEATDEEQEKIAAQYKVDVLRRGIRMLREWIVRNTSADPDHIIDDEVRKLS